MNNHEDAYIGTTKREVIAILDFFLSLGIFLPLYLLLMQHYLGFTLGQKLFGLKIVNTKTGGKPTTKQLVFRELCSVLGLTGLGSIIALLTHSYYSGFYWDRWAHTKVIPAKFTLIEFNKILDTDRERLFPSNKPA